MNNLGIIDLFNHNFVRHAAEYGINVSISETSGMKIITTPAWTMHISNETIRLLPPTKWWLELMELLENKTINHTIAKKVIEIWQQDTLERIKNNIDKLLV